LITDLAKRIGNIVFFATIDMLPTDILKLLPEEIIEFHFPTTSSSPATRKGTSPRAIGKRKRVQISDQRQSFWTDVRKHKGRMRNAMLTAAPDIITARLEGKHEWPWADTTADHRRNIWSSMFKVDTATILFSQLS